MAIKNYTSEVSAHKSLGEIQGALAEHGARKIMTEYDEAGKPSGITFAVMTPAGYRAFMLRGIRPRVMMWSGGTVSCITTACTCPRCSRSRQTSTR